MALLLSPKYSHAQHALPEQAQHPPNNMASLQLGVARGQWLTSAQWSCGGASGKESGALLLLLELAHANQRACIIIKKTVWPVPALPLYVVHAEGSSWQVTKHLRNLC